MAAFDIEHLLAEISPDAPCGENLEYDAAFIALEQAAKPKAEQQFGTTIIPGEEPDWVEVRRLALKLLERTKDLRVYDQLLRASLRLDGVTGFAGGLALLHGVLGRYWEGLHPQLDPDDDNDPTFRVNVVAGLCDPESFLQPLRETPLVSSRNFGRFGLRDIAAEGGEEGRADQAAVNGAFLEAAVDALRETANAIRRAADDVRGIENVITDQVGASNAPDLSALGAVLREASRVMTQRLEARGIREEEEVVPAEEAVADEVDGAAPAAPRPAGGISVPGQISNREDVLKTLDRLCEYYARYEPSSPVPLLLRRAKRLAPMSFLDVLQDLIPDAVTKAQIFSGPAAEE
ncbi:hypothetical protein GCM10011611_16120 [Aliidongia dinghuensis]|uniref:ImpA N-terminal domain-containing protein n=1 Tax=Aliidongia dinghuensis TaxID=1867774 RepID=A0A8J2YT17_9PROT|nr:type VI secretion system protein TssA [Aliidongia dinghuensis]GGF11248.1 hypothetical protein GCM10011611_16120 [Aliidongia dinghuensis]